MFRKRDRAIAIVSNQAWALSLVSVVTNRVSSTFQGALNRKLRGWNTRSLGELHV